MMRAEPSRSSARHLALGTISFAVCFAAWGLISAFAPRFRALFHLSATETSLLVAVPVLLGSLTRIPLGMLTDRLGGRVVFTAGFPSSVFFLPSTGRASVASGCSASASTSSTADT